ncbi:MAG: helix-hairpin-helix domain-containing protein [Lachnospiraceae bacterium]|nr:helix-hairpin-helix domain-containing protein [Lachnospiraceae bacterium]
MSISKKNQYIIVWVLKYLSILFLVLALGILYSCQREDGGESIKVEVSGDDGGLNGSGGSDNSGDSGGSDGSGNSGGSNNLDDSDNLGSLENTDGLENPDGSENPNGSGNLDDNRKFICVHIAGFVVNPGVYNVAEGARIYEIVRLAGGFLPEADESYLNLASVVFDGQKIMVLSKEEAKTAKPFVSQIDKETEKKLININTATKEELMQLSGIGESRALSIISYREKNGDFKKIEDIMKIPGIKEAAFEKIKDYICVD